MRQIPKTVRHLGIISPLARDNASDNSSQVVLTAKNELLLANIIVYRHQCLKPGPYYCNKQILIPQFSAVLIPHPGLAS